jgi:hypothetical protein
VETVAVAPVLLAEAVVTPAAVGTLVAGAAGKPSNVTSVVNVGSLPGQAPLTLLPPLAPPALPVFALVELCNCTSLAPSIRRKRWSACATTVWLVAQPVSVKIGVLPGGVLEAGVELAVAAVALALEPGVVPAAPTAPCNALSEVPAGSTRPSSCRA